jgi:glutamate-1-semialdehyde 2,1-aminomutase
MKVYREEPVIETLWKQGQRLADGLERAIADHDLEEHIGLFGRPCCLVYGTKDAEGMPSQPFRTLFLQEIMKRGVIAPSLIVSYSHDDEAVDRTVEAFHGAFGVYRKALEEGIEGYLESRPVQPVWRTFNEYRLG